MTALLVDGQNIAYAVNYTRELSNSEGRPTHATLGFLRVIGNLALQYGAKSIYTTWDGGRSTERMKLYPKYKANRDAKSNDAEWVRKREALDQQIKDIRELLDFLSVTQVCGQGVEGDDLIALLIMSPKMQDNCLIVSGDKDFWQLVTPEISIVNPINGHKLVTPENFSEHTNGLRPYQYLDFKAMVGDSSDGIPGCQGVGEKTALKILKQFDLYEVFYKAVQGGYKPGALERRAYDGKVEFEKAKRLMDLRNPLVDFHRPLDGSPGRSNPEKFKAKMQTLDVSEPKVDAILKSFETVMEAK